MVGHDSSEIGDITSLIGRAAATAILLAVLLVLLGTYIFRRELARRVSHIRQTTQQIGAGQLSSASRHPQAKTSSPCSTATSTRCWTGLSF